MSNVNFDVLIYYVIFAVFVFYQQMHVKDFGGASQGFQAFLSVFAFGGMITGVAFIAYYAIQVSFIGAGIIFVAGLLAVFIGSIFERFLGAHTLSFIGFIAWPLCAYLMFTSI
jgi:hypothetical protein